LDTRKVAQQYRLSQWTQQIRECRSSGQTVTCWCAEHNIKETTYFYWLRRIRKAACEALPSMNEGNNSIVPLNIPIARVAAESADRQVFPDIIIRCDAMTLEIHNNASQTLIENTLRALQNVR